MKKLPWESIPDVSDPDTGHGRKVRRTVKAVDAPDWIDFPGAGQVLQIRRTRTLKGRKTTEVVYVICSLTMAQAQPRDVAAWVTGHWSIESLHWIRDVVFDEDRHQLRTGDAPQVMATLRNTAISLIRIAGHTQIAARLRHNARNDHRVADLILTT